MNAIEKELAPLRNQLTHHPIYQNINSLEDIQVFMENHVFAVWDFMSLVKKLQLELTCTQLPWTPSAYPVAGRLINEIVWGEETDLNKDNQPMSHFEMYVQAMEEVKADTSGIHALLSHIKEGKTIEASLKEEKLDESVNQFLKFTFETIASNKLHVIAAVFTFGREDLIPDMFTEMVKHLRDQGAEIDHLIYYLDRHIEVDGDEHGPMALQMIEELCENDSEKINEAIEASKIALQNRINLWDGILNKLTSPSLI